ncbi:amidase [uncultured Maritimibacter sp.]|jgi:Asp-tRNA(Asn)/Glu-tRNA(Gln) amidotransferase A subunit family amidase|uniref:amidase n=1 Tax=uncultured Maritimibacter sp. TaxID=991866 RepID=UPI000B0F6B0C|nr:amidase [uncultured Maritimibacter sp.]
MKDLIPEDMTAWAIARDVNGGTRRALDVLEATQAVIAAREPEVQAFAFYDPRIARAQAEAGPIGPLAGVTVTVKDVIATRDMPTGHNNARYAGQGTGVDAACVDTLRSAGAVILSKSVTTEFAATDRGGKTRNPHDLARTPGGSSSGSAAAVAAGMAAIGLGTQTGGSTIRPASFCGVWGWKPTWGVISREGLKLYSLTCDTLGLYARDLGDFNLLADVYDLDPAPRPSSLSGLRIGVVRPPLWDRVEAPMRNALDTASAQLASAGAVVEDVTLHDDFAALDAAHGTILMREGRAAFLNEARARDDLHADFVAMVANAAGITPEDARAAYRTADLCRARADDLLAGYDAVIAPSACGEAPRGLDKTGDPSMNSFWTLLSVPVVSVPAFTGPSGMPMGISVITRRYADRTALAVAGLSAKVVGGAIA